jgi:hypothetical protein
LLVHGLLGDGRECGEKKEWKRERGRGDGSGSRSRRRTYGFAVALDVGALVAHGAWVSMLVGEALTVRVVATRLVRRRRRVEGCMVVWCGGLCG